MRKNEQRTIDDIDVRTQQLPAMAAYALAARLLKACGPAIVPIALGAGPGGVASLDAGMVAQSLAQLDAEQVVPLTRDLLKYTVVVVDGKQRELTSDDAINSVFSGRLPAMFKTIRFALEVNFGDFFAES